ncbi:Pla2g12a [Symbiodinium natans]|uniref:Pla2g12a protein n=1 Tax=Symbiodinium natans TaxID=878477 RepID=A0A812Q2N5_9DINO|nr:Pla2g12a [Symbiodinium natans]
MAVCDDSGALLAASADKLLDARGEEELQVEAEAEDDEEAEEEPALQREVTAAGSGARSLGLALAEVYGARAKTGLAHAKDYYVELPPASCSLEKWRELASLAQEGAVACCPTAAAFFDGLSEGLGWDVYELLLDFEIYTLELQRRDRVQARIRPPTESSSSGSDSSSESLVLDANSEEEDAPSADGVQEASEPSGKRKKLPQSGRCTGFAIAGGSANIGGHTLASTAGGGRSY